MFYGDNVQDTRGFFFKTWEKYQQKHPLEPLESQLIAVILHHPEYHSCLEQQNSEQQYAPELGATNPFLHMGLHLTIRDQIALDRPEGIKAIYQQLQQDHSDPHQIEHLLFEPLMHCLWTAQRYHQTPNEHDYLLACQALVKT